jgi:hypothetical protein
VLFWKKYLEDFIEVLIDESKNPSRDPLLNDFHTIYNKMCKKIGRDNINFIFEGNHSSISNLAYTLVRA